MTIDADSAARVAVRREQFHEADVVVVGAGVFGCAAAYALANQGRSVLLLERWMHEPDRIVGELLQPGGVDALVKIGLGHCLEGIDAIPCHGYHVLYHKDDAVLEYPAADPITGRVKAVVARNMDARSYVAAKAQNRTAKKEENCAYNGGQKQSKRAEGRSFHHGRFIMKLRQACRAHSNITMFETDVQRTIYGEHTPEVLGVESRTTLPSGEKKPDFFFGQLTIIADGYASRFRKQVLGPTKVPQVKSKFYALELIDCPFQPFGFGHVVIGAAPGPVLLYQIGTHETRALIDVPDREPAASPANGGVRGYIEKVVIPTLPTDVQPSFRAALAALGEKQIPKSMPNSWLPATKQTTQPGVLLLGDAYNMRHPLTGGGMTVAFNDVLLLAELIAPEKVPDLADSERVAEAMKAFHWRRKAWTSIINVLAQALYSLFAAQDDRLLVALQKGCFEYFRRGYTDEPLGMMSGMLQEPLTLAYHFFTVAFVGIWINAVEVCNGGSLLGWLKAPLALVDAVLILWKACVVFLPVMFKELQ
ncbi:squalene epoxidase-domain-containing protein [Coniochaeta sp. 2T2.1]|nr:squalene epoxidase-domain-containing protein [Coniochaeta sp. 2T2.1]